MEASKFTLESIQPAQEANLTTYVVGETLEEQELKKIHQELADLEAAMEHEYPDARLRNIAELALAHINDDTGEIPAILVEAAEETAKEVLEQGPEVGTTTAVIALGETYDITQDPELLHRAQEILKENEMMARYNPELEVAVDQTIAGGDISFNASYQKARRDNYIRIPSMANMAQT